MNAHVLCFDKNTQRSMGRRRSLEDAGFVVLHAQNEVEAPELLQSGRVDVVCIDSYLMSNGETGVASGIKSVKPHVPVVLIHDDGAIPERFREYVDVVIDEPDFDATARWLIEELCDCEFPFFVRWFDDWMRRSSEGTGDEPLPVY